MQVQKCNGYNVNPRQTPSFKFTLVKPSSPIEGLEELNDAMVEKLNKELKKMKYDDVIHIKRTFFSGDVKLYIKGLLGIPNHEVQESFENIKIKGVFQGIIDLAKRLEDEITYYYQSEHIYPTDYH